MAAEAGRGQVHGARSSVQVWWGGRGAPTRLLLNLVRRFTTHTYSVPIVPGNRNTRGPDEAAGSRLVWFGRWVQWRRGGEGFGGCHWVGRTHVSCWGGAGAEEGTQRDPLSGVYGLSEVGENLWLSGLCVSLGSIRMYVASAERRWPSCLELSSEERGTELLFSELRVSGVRRGGGWTRSCEGGGERRAVLLVCSGGVPARW